MTRELFISNLWRWKVGKVERPYNASFKVVAPNNKTGFEDFMETQKDPKFDTMRMNRKVMGFLRYGKKLGEAHKKWDYIASMERKLEEYRKTKNAELLLDIANYAELEFVEGENHFEALDDSRHALDV